MKSLIPALAVMALLAPAAAHAQESRLAAPFRSFCLETDARPGAVAARARAAGYVAPPAAMMRAAIGQMPQMAGAAALWQVYDGGLVMVVLGRMTLPNVGSSPVQAKVCAVIDMPSESDPTGTLRSVLGDAGPLHKMDAFDFFVFGAGPDGGRSPVDLNDTLRVQRLTKDGELRMAMAGQAKSADVDMSLIMLMAPQMENAASLTTGRH